MINYFEYNNIQETNYVKILYNDVFQYQQMNFFKSYKKK